MSDINLDVEIDLDGRLVSIKDLLEIDQTAMADEFANQAARYAYFAVLEAEASYQLSEAERRLKVAEADAFISYKHSEEYIPPGSRTVTDELARQLVDLDGKVRAIKETMSNADYEYRLMRALATAFHQRADMLQSLGVMLRAEMDMTGMAVKEDVGDRLRRAVEERGG